MRGQKQLTRENLRELANCLDIMIRIKLRGILNEEKPQKNDLREERKEIEQDEELEYDDD